MPDKNWQFELEEYIKQGEPDRTEKSEAWQTAIGLQAVDGLNTSAYLLDTAKDHIEGKITIDEAQQRIHSYYEQRTTRTEIENETKEADIVSARIAKLLGEKPSNSHLPSGSPSIADCLKACSVTPGRFGSTTSPRKSGC